MTEGERREPQWEDVFCCGACRHEFRRSESTKAMKVMCPRCYHCDEHAEPKHELLYEIPVISQGERREPRESHEVLHPAMRSAVMRASAMVPFCRCGNAMWRHVYDVGDLNPACGEYLPREFVASQPASSALPVSGETLEGRLRREALFLECAGDGGTGAMRVILKVAGRQPAELAQLLREAADALASRAGQEPRYVKIAPDQIGQGEMLLDRAYLLAVADRIIETDGCAAHDWLVGVAKHIKDALASPAPEGQEPQ